ncbi:polyamine-modulated factor 1 L homeolog [Xenopus laevis]|nr:polyamine-modulated factor 1 L homeolog [Xenopus laevis]
MEAEEKSAEGFAEGDPGTSQEIEAAPSENPSRMLIFNTLVDKFLDGLVQAGSYQRFARCYKRFYKLQPEMTRSIYDQFVFQLQNSIRDEIQEIRDEGNLEALLDSLDKMEKEAGDRTELAWRPSGVPEQDLRSHLVPYLLQQRDYLHKVLKEREEENKRLAQAVLLGRRKIQEMQKEIETRKQAWQELSKAQRELILSVEEPK